MDRIQKTPSSKAPTKEAQSKGARTKAAPTKAAPPPAAASTVGLTQVLLGNQLKKLVTISNVIIDNAVFRFHYKATSVFFFSCSALICMGQFFGKPITCVSKDDYGRHDEIDPNIKNRVINSYCWLEGTFSLAKALSGKIGEIPYPGVDTYEEGDKIIEHTYYQWVFLVLFLQGCFFYATRFIWKRLEGGKIKVLMSNLNNPAIDDDLKTSGTEGITDYLDDRKSSNRLGFFGSQYEYALKYFGCEALNFLHVLGQLYFIDLFLGGEFTTYGIKVFSFLNMEQKDREDPMVRVFPIMTKCRFHRFGSGGSVQRHDVLCLLPLNVFNQYVYVIIWVWLLVLATISGLAVLYRLICLSSVKVRIILTEINSVFTPPEVIKKVVSQLSYGEWFLMHMLNANIDDAYYKNLISSLLVLDIMSPDEEAGKGL